MSRPRPLAAAAVAGYVSVAVAASFVLPATAGGLASGWLWWVQSVAGIAFGVPATLLLRQDARARMGWLLAAVAVLMATSTAAAAWAWVALVGRPGSLAGGATALWVASVAWLPAYFLLPTVLLLLAPHGRLPSPRWRALLWASSIAVAVATVGMAVTPYRTGTGADVVIPGQPADVHNPLASSRLADALAWGVPVLLACVLLSLTALVLRRRRAVDDERRQLDLVAVGAVLTVVLMATAWLVPRPWFLLVVALALTPYPAALGLAAARHRLWDLDVVVRRSFVYAALTAVVVAAYVVAIVGLGGALGRTTGAPLLATALVAVGAAPLRGRLQQLVDRRLYGERDAPVRAVQRVAARWEGTPADDAAAVLDGMAEELARSLRLSHVRLESVDGVGGAAGSAGYEPLTRLTLSHAGAVVGQLVVGAREPGRPLHPRDLSALEQVGAYVAAVMHAVALMADLRRSREQVVVAREEERRRLRRDLHDGLGPQLAAIALQLETVRDLADGPDTPAGAMAESLRMQLRGVVGDVRRIVDDLRPPSLDDLGLAETVAQQADRFRAGGLDVDVVVGRLPQLPAAVELAVLRIVGEALTNVARHSGASRCTVAIASTGEALEVTVADDGVGLGDGLPAQAGVGLASMRERAWELGGSWQVESAPGAGTVLRVVLPLSVRSEV